MKHDAGRTAPEEATPPVHVLEAASSQERKETEDLLAGFDRPGRAVEKTPGERDFVGYYARPKKKSGSPASGAVLPAPAVSPSSSSSSRARPPPQKDVATVITPRKRDALPAGLAWLGAALLMLGTGGVVAYLATSEPHPNTGSSTGPSAATTITAASPPPSDRDVVPLPAPAEPITTTVVVVTEPAPSAIEAQRPSARREPRGTPSANGTGAAAPTTLRPATAASTESRRPPPRDDFIRDL